jgi:hypothetical protein
MAHMGLNGGVFFFSFYLPQAYVLHVLMTMLMVADALCRVRPVTGQLSSVSDSSQLRVV